MMMKNAMENIFLNMINTHDFREKKNKWFHEKTPFIFRKKKKKVRRVMCGTKKNIDSLNLSPPFKKNITYYVKKLTNRGFLSSKIIISCVFFCQIKINIFSSPNRCGIISWNFNSTKKTIETLVISLFISEAIKTKLNNINQIEHNMWEFI